MPKYVIMAVVTLPLDANGADQAGAASTQVASALITIGGSSTSVYTQIIEPDPPAP